MIVLRDMVSDWLEDRSFSGLVNTAHGCACDNDRGLLMYDQPHVRCERDKDQCQPAVFDQATGRLVPATE